MPANSQKENKAEVAVIDDKLLIAGCSENNDTIVVTSGEVSLVDLAPKALTLTLSFKSVGHIENLVGFDRLEKLCLDNNFIEEIVNLSHLKCLKWLDLSFNKIRRIQGLDQLKRLEDLSLYCNKISVVEGNILLMISSLLPSFPFPLSPTSQAFSHNILTSHSTTTLRLGSMSQFTVFVLGQQSDRFTRTSHTITTNS